MTYIVAGHKNQFNHYIRKHNISPDEAVFVTSLDQLRGIGNQTLIRCGSWWERGLKSIGQLAMRGWTIEDAKD